MAEFININADLAGVYFSSTATGDFDSDGDLDLLVAGRNTLITAENSSEIDFSNLDSTKIYINDGSDGFSEDTNNNLPGVEFGGIATGDFDGDEDLDLLITGLNNNSGYISKIYTNDGTGGFSEDTNSSLAAVGLSSVATGDFDGDNDLDLLITGRSGPGVDSGISKIYINNGSGGFSEDTSNNLTGVDESAVATGDFDGDEDIDLLITGFDNNGDSISKIYTNDGTGGFSEDTENNLPGNSFGSIATGDFDGDNDLDLFITGNGFKTSVYTNNGSGVFSENTEANPNGFDNVDSSGSLATGDFDKDGDLDLLLTGGFDKQYVSKVYTNDGSGVFSEDTEANLMGATNGSVATGDFDGDSYLDLLITGLDNSDNPTSEVYRNETNNIPIKFTEITDSNNPLNGVKVVDYATPAFADLDGDGDLDAFVGRYGSPISYFKNTGNSNNPNFSEVTGSNNPVDSIDVGYFSKPSFADLDGDGDLDAFVGDGYGNINYFENTGSSNNPNFSEVTGSNNPFDGIDVDGFAAPTFADLDRDGDLDAFVGNQDGNINYFENTGSCCNPNFSEVTGSNNPFDGIDVGINAAPTFADLDRDGDLDAFVGNGDGDINYFQNFIPSYNESIRVEAEDYLNYYDTTAGNRGGAYRDDDVDLQATSDMEGGFNVGWIASGEWLTYDVDVPQTGWYEIQARVASAGNQPQHLDLALDGQSTSLNFDSTGGWQSWEDVSGGNLNLSAGSHELRLDLVTSSFNLNYIDLVPSESIRVEAEDYLNYYDTTAGNRGGAYRDDDVDLQATSDTGGGFNVGWIASGEWLTYDLDVSKSGWYEIQARVASNADTQHLDLSLDGQSASLNFDSTGGWQSWEYVSGGNLNLSAGSHELRLDLGTSNFNLNYIDLVPLESI